MMSCIGSIAAMVGMLTLASTEVTTTIGTTADFPPYTSLDAQGQMVGLDRDIGDELCRRIMLECTWVVTDFDQLIPGVMAGDFDFAIAGMASSDEREQVVNFTRDYSNTEGNDDFVGRPDAPGPDQALIGVQSGTIHERHLMKTGRDVRVYPTQTATIAALAAGEVELIFGSFGSSVIRQQFDAAGYAYLYAESSGLDGPAIAVCKGREDLRDQLDTALAAMQADGTLDAFNARWF
jgi:polar amino acid transport system substrate-binding protein